MPRSITIEEQRQLEEKIDRVLAMVREEVLAASIKHPPYNSPHEGAAVIREEFEELWDHVKADTGRTRDAMDEAVQVAATSVRYVVDLSSGYVPATTPEPSDSIGAVVLAYDAIGVQ